MDGNRTRRTGVARPSRFEGGGAHQVPGHLRPVTVAVGYRAVMKKLLLLAILVALGVVAARKLRVD